jgi:hypothetical protein
VVFFAISRAGFESYSGLDVGGTPLWVCAGVLSDLELANLRSERVDVSAFNYALEPSDWAGIDDALQTIREHHPGQTVWLGL